MNPISNVTTSTGPIAKPQQATPQAADAGASIAQDQLDVGLHPARGVEVEVIVDYFFFKRKTTFSLMPQADGQLLFKQKDGDGRIRQQRVLGNMAQPTAMSMDIKLDVPFFSKALRVDLAHEDGVSSVKVSDLKSGQVLKQAASDRH